MARARLVGISHVALEVGDLDAARMGPGGLQKSEGARRERVDKSLEP